MYKIILAVVLLLIIASLGACGALFNDPEGCTSGYKVKADDDCTSASPFYDPKLNGPKPTTPPAPTPKRN